VFEQAADETAGRLRRNSAHCAGLDICVFHKQQTAAGKVRENAIAISGGVIADSVNVAVLDVEGFAGQKTNAIEARACAVD
jgi:hypothetical protein